MLEWGRLSESQAQILLVAIQPLIQEVERTRNFLERAPEFEEMYPDGAPDIIIGELLETEAETVPVGFFLNSASTSFFSAIHESFIRSMVSLQRWVVRGVGCHLYFPKGVNTR